MQNMLYPIKTHAHDPAQGETPVKWDCIENRPEPGVIEREYRYECLGSSLLPIKGATTPPKYLVLPGVARYNKGYGQTELWLNGTKLLLGADWTETDRPATSRRDDTSAYWTHLVTIHNPVSDGRYVFIWRDRIITDFVRGIREARVSDTGGVLWDGHVTLPVQTGGIERFPNGVAWDPLPPGYKIEIWRKTKHKQSGTPTDDALHRRSGVRWMIWRTVPASDLSANIDKLRRNYSAGALGTETYKLAYLRPDGTRSQLSLETAIYHGCKPWGPAKSIHDGRVRVK